MDRSRIRPESALAHPLWIASLAVLAINDHALKTAGPLPSIVTGKLSDLAGLVVAPALLATLLRARTPRAWWLCAAAVAAVFSAINLSPTAAHAFTGAFASLGIPFAVWPDPTDLIALPAVSLSYWIARRASSTQAGHPTTSRGWIASAFAAALLCAASSPWPTAPPVVDTHQVYVQHHGGALFALDTTSGALLSRVPTEGGNVFPPAVRHGVVYWIDSAGRLAAASTAPPLNRWILRDCAELGPYAEVAAVDDYRVFVLAFASPAQLAVFDRNTGEQAWQITVDRLRYPVVSVADDTVLFVNGPAMFALDARTGERHWVFEASDDLGRPTVTGDRIHVADDAGKLYEVDLAEGGQVWSTGLKHGDCATWYPIAVDGAAAYVCADNQLTAIDLSTRQPRWSRDCRGAALVGSDVACIDADRVMAFDRASGTPRWTTRVDDRLWSFPVSGDGMVFARNHVGRMYALRGADGSLVWTLDMDEGRVVR
jgi:outer membrane protein assembly factor BamB